MRIETLNETRDCFVNIIIYTELLKLFSLRIFEQSKSLKLPSRILHLTSLHYRGENTKKKNIRLS